MKLFNILLIILLLGINKGFAQYEPITVTELPSDISARTYPEKAYDGSYCSLLKIQTEVEGVSAVYNNNINPIKIEQKTGELWVYVPIDAKSITIRHADVPDVNINLKDYKIKKLKEKTTYEITYPLPFFFIREYFHDNTPLQDIDETQIPPILVFHDRLEIADESKSKIYVIKKYPNMYEGWGKIKIKDPIRNQSGTYNYVTINLKPGFVYKVRRGLTSEQVPFKVDISPIKKYKGVLP